MEKEKEKVKPRFDSEELKRLKDVKEKAVKDKKIIRKSYGED